MSGTIIPGTNATEAGSVALAIYDRLVAEFGEPDEDGQEVWRRVAASVARGVVENIIATLSDTSFLQVLGGSLVGEEDPGGGGGAPTTSEYLVSLTDAGLANERVVADTTTVAWDFSTPGVGSASVPNNGIGNAQIRDSAATSVIGRAGGTVGDPADIVASADDRLLGRSGGALSFLQATNAMLANMSSTSVKANATGSSAAPTDLQATVDDRVLGRSAGALSFLQVTNAMLANMAANAVKANPTAGSAVAQDVALATNTVLGRLAGNIAALTATQLTTLVNVFTSVLSGAVPSGSGGSVDAILRGNATWANVITRIAGSSGAAGPDITFQVLTAGATTTSSTASAFMTTTGLAVGTYTYKYKVVYESNALTGGIGWGVHHTGSETQALASAWIVGVTATVGRADQDAATAQSVYGNSQRLMSTTSPQAFEGVDAVDRECLLIIEGILEVTISGDLVLYISSEDNASTITVHENTTLELQRIR